MEFVNHTPFPAQTFLAIDQNRQDFHVVVLRQTYAWNSIGEMEFASEQKPLCEKDEFFDTDRNPDSDDPQQESDLCPYKPACDVIVNATAYAPLNEKGEAILTNKFDVRLVVKRPDEPMPLPDAPQGLNPYMSPSAKEIKNWRLSVEQTKTSRITGNKLIDKTLRITGAREFKRCNFFWRTFASLIEVITLGWINLPRWRLTWAKSLLQLQLNLSNTWGGDNRVGPDDKAAKRIPKKNRLNATLAAALVKADIKSPVAISAWQANPAGKGFATQWYLGATKKHRVAAPQITHISHPTQARHFELARRDKLDPNSPLACRLTAGYGIRPKGHPLRASLVGTIDADFINSSTQLPEDFDFAVWNAAWPDQQVNQLLCNEEFELTNLCAGNTPGAVRDQDGNTVLKVKLPSQSAQVLVRLQSGEVFLRNMRLDTLLIEPEARCVSLIWRVAFPRLQDIPIRALEVQTMGQQKRLAFDAEVAAVKSSFDVLQKDGVYA